MSEVNVYDVRMFLEDVGVINEVGVRLHADPMFHQVWPDGQHANDTEINLFNSDTLALRRSLERIAPTLAWVSFYNHNLGRPSDEHIENRYVAERNKHGLIFLTQREILDEGKLRPAMETWLGALMTRQRFSSADVEPFKQLL